MDNSYDMCVNYETLCSIELKLSAIIKGLSLSVAQIKQSIIYGQDFLEGNQYEKAKFAANNCIIVSERAIRNTRNAMNYIMKLKQLTDEYSRCSYIEDII